jgi:hypothetical protein
MAHKKNFHNRVLHPNRYFIWALIVIIFGGIWLTLHIITVGYQTETEAVFPELKTRKVYTNEVENYQLRYPKDWQIDTGTIGTVTFLNPSDLTESISVESYELGSERVIRRSFNITEETKPVTKDGMTITMFQGTNLNKAEIEAAIIKTKNKLYFMHGHADSFEGIVNSFRAL